MNIYEATRGRWREILLSISIPEHFLTRRNCPCPFCGGKDRFRFTDHNQGGLYICNQCGNGNGLQFAMRFLNIGQYDAIRLITPIIGTLMPPRRTQEMSNKKDDYLRRIWAAAKPITDNDRAYRYLKNRRLIDEPGTCRPELRYHPAMRYYDKQRGFIAEYPAMLARIHDSSNRPISIHCTYLSKDGMATKAVVDNPKKILAPIGSDGANIRLFPCDKTLCVTEGIETALAVHKRTFGKPVWALITAGGFKKFVPPVGVTRLEIWADNDANFTGQKVAYELANRLAISNPRLNIVVQIPSLSEADWADF